MLLILNPCEECENVNDVQWRIQNGGGDRPPPNRHKNHSLKKAISVEKLGWGGGGYTLHARS